jgi:hypothetical protein
MPLKTLGPIGPRAIGERASVNEELLSSKIYHFQLMSFETGKLRCFPEFSNNIIVAQRALLSKELGKLRKF